MERLAWIIQRGLCSNIGSYKWKRKGSVRVIHQEKAQLEVTDSEDTAAKEFRQPLGGEKVRKQILL